jgi:hypothetical protein
VAEALGVKGRPWLKIERDKKYGVMELPVRIELPYDFPPNQELLELAAQPEIDLATEQWERLGDGHGGKYQRMWQVPVRWQISKMPTKTELDQFNMLKKHEPGAAVNIDAVKPTIVLNAVLTFVAPLIQVNQDEADEYSGSVNESEGFASDLPPEYQRYLGEEAPARSP